jgi:hypothetical protein
MPSDPDRQRVPDSAHPRTYVLWCATCGTLASRSPADLNRFTRLGWMECCGQVMCYFPDGAGEADSPGLLQFPG